MWSPLYVTLFQSTIVNAISNILAQIIDQWKSEEPFRLNFTALVQFVTYCIIIVPINFYWQRWMEAHYPGFPTSLRRWFSRSSSPRAAPGGRAVDNHPVLIPIEELAVKEKSIASVQSSSHASRLPSASDRNNNPNGTKNFVIKFLLDQTVGSVMNIWLFIVLINLLKGSSWAFTATRVREDMPGIMIARLKYRPVVASLMYTVIPVDRRVVFGSACGVIWSVYLSLHSLSR
ncbi:Mpv17 / PMP22 family protein [Talaromyces islandicus]|uniref:Mpv17 / PMP22 family protein n=1 Tax=Talaromyces islandicus TaxID=28573 RepID=A0A0U1LSU5_TALIS|nr:Mpv17 / PMP22 family protein [Talaromyces islandicus]